ncbi:Aminoglycoside phosphotransferase [Macrophomina phaseolina MS6]|uniref:Aminoglycoside phosphotransferase n=1 Tax=Macrophomina phaseolina (strain MS6) TaxID=1126212 RepID=K2SDL2_MACPH|nr:Aminoglycoside phosphotransferase [Macrophomina phaseolina MS6]
MTDEVLSEKGHEVGNDDTPATLVPNAFHLPTEDGMSKGPVCINSSGPPKLSCKFFENKMVWEYNPWTCDYEAKWKIDPSIEVITELARNHYELCSLPNEDINVEFLAEGSFNKVYTVSSKDKTTGAAHECIFRCSLPSAPWYKTQSEVATMEFVRKYTKIPVPKVFVFDSSMDNALGLEWMMMEKINGKMFGDVEEGLDFDAKVRLYRQVAEWIDELSRIRFDKIGALYHNWSLPLSNKSSFKIGPLSISDFNADLRLDYPINRGPFASFEEYYNAHISVYLYEALDPRHKARVEAWKKQDEMEEAGEEIKEEVPETRHTLKGLARTPQLCLALQSVLPTVLKGKQLSPDSTRLHHFDIAKRNILVDDRGHPVALIDWEISWATIPHKIPRYPPLIIDEEAEEPERWELEEEKDESRLEEEKAWEETLLRREFDKRLQELASPHLETGSEPDVELNELDKTVNALYSMENFSYIERKQEEMRKLF